MHRNLYNLNISSAVPLPIPIPKLPSGIAKAATYMPIIGPVLGALGTVTAGTLGFLGARGISQGVKEVPDILRQFTNTIQSSLDRQGTLSPQQTAILEQLAKTQMLEAQRAQQQQQILQAFLDLQRSQPQYPPQVIQYVSKPSRSKPNRGLKKRKSKRIR